ncbi:MAG: amino acid permease [Selenomonas sp.]|uniref:amino acid permease n=1 Tax=Selenomonas sp. TaxID=2053611 RepID=UPI0025DD9B59|nr:amino acid permease [Selenomonas sp.]MCR5756572.1 amino acid permease [Selenomonas sp.]
MNTQNYLEPQKDAKGHLFYPLNIWALSFGCAVGWGAFMLPGNLFLPHAGPVGSILAIALASLSMLIIGANFCKLAQRYRDNGGFFAYVREVMGYDHAFLAAWALFIAYLACIWINASAVVLLIRFFCGDILQWGFHYQVAGFDVYAGEIATTWLVLIIFACFSAYAGRAKRPIHTLFTLILFLGIILLFCGVLAMSPNHASFYPAFEPNNGNTLFLQVFSMLMLAPWLFFGFESITHGGEEFRFPIQRTFPLIAGSVAAIFLAYCLPIAIAVIGRPPEFATWHEYMNAWQTLQGNDALPVFHGISSLLGSKGLVLLTVTVLAGIITCINGFYRGCSFLIQSLAKDNLLPSAFASSAEDGTPRRAIFLILLISLPITFLGRTAILWLVDAITISASIAYAYVSLCRYREAKSENQSSGKLLGGAGLTVSLLFFFCPIIPNLLLGSDLDTESYLMLAIWSILGLIYYWYLFKHDRQERFGKSFSLCTILLFLNFFSTSLWLQQVTIEKIPLAQQGGYAPVRDILNQNSTIQLILILLILLFMADIFTTMRRREHDLSKDVLAEQRSSRTRGALLANMTHDIGLMMNALMSYVKLASDIGQEYQQRKGKCPPENLAGLWQSLRHAESISHYFLHLVREMELVDKIHTRQLELFPAPTDIRYSLQQIKNIFVTQMQEKNIDFMVYTAQLENPYVYCDNNRLQRILLNLINLAYEFTPPKGSVAVTLAQKGFAYHQKKLEQDAHSFWLCADYELRIKDSGQGMPQEFLQRLNSKERLSLSHDQEPEQSLAITQHLIDLFQGSLSVTSTPTEGTEIVIQLTLKLAKQSAVSLHVEQDVLNVI